MVALLPHRHETGQPKPRACTSGAMYWVVTDGGAERGVCGPHLHLMLGQFLIEHPHIPAEEPEPSVRCEYIEVERAQRFAVLVRQIPTSFGEVRLYRLSEPLRGFEYVTVSAVSHARPETYVFGSDAAGSMSESYELPGSLPGVWDHRAALESAGYVVSEVSR
jgi:hypothetical protein